MTKNVLIHVDAKGVATVTLNRPQTHNAFDDVFIQELLHVLHILQTDSTVKVVILAALGKNFSAGADLNWMRRMAEYSYEENLQDALALSELMQTLKFLSKPVIARVQGAVYGGGVGLVACCDITIAATDASFCLSEVKIGLIPAIISPYVIMAIGEQATRRYSLTAEQISAQEALRLGLVAQLAAPEELDQAVQQMVEQLLDNSPQAISAAKALINRVSVNPYDRKHLQKNAAAIASIRVSAEGQEGLTAFLEKRQPAWREKKS